MVRLVLLLEPPFMDKLGVLGHLLDLPPHLFVLHMQYGQLFLVIYELLLLVLNCQNRIFLFISQANNLVLQLINSRLVFIRQEPP